MASQGWWGSLTPDETPSPYHRPDMTAVRSVRREEKAEEKRWRETAEAVLSTPAMRREMSLRNPAFFDSYYCGMRFAKHRKRWLTTMVEAFAEARVTRRTQDQKKIKLLLLGPRKHGKTEAVITFATLAVCADRSLRILIIGSKEGSAKKRLRRIKQLLTNERVTADWTQAPDDGYGPFQAEKRGSDESKWDERMIYVIRSTSDLNPTVEAAGAGSSTIGGHYDIIIIDDPDDKDSVKSPDVRKARKEWLKSEIEPMLEPGGLMVMIGTRKHHDDIYGMALKEPTWRVIKERAIIEPDSKVWSQCFKPVKQLDEHGRDVIVDWEIEGDYEVLWPEERPLKSMLYLLDSMGPTLFGREMQHEVTDDSTAAFKRAHLDVACRRGTKLVLSDGPWPQGLLIVQAWDPAFVTDERHAETSDSDYQAGVVWGIDTRNRDRYLMEIDRARGRGHDQKVNDVVRMWNAWRAPSDPVRCSECGWWGQGDPEEHVCPDCDGELDAMLLTVADHVKHGWAFAVGMEKNNGGQFLAVAAERAQDMKLFRHWTGREVSDPYKGVPVLGAHFETGRVVLPYGSHGTQQIIDIVCNEFHSLGTSAHKDVVMAIWIAETLGQRALHLYEKHIKRYGAPRFDLAA